MCFTQLLKLRKDEWKVNGMILPTNSFDVKYIEGSISEKWVGNKYGVL